MAEDLKKPIEESSLERLKRVAEELKKTGVKESRRENLIENEKTPNPEISTIERPVPQKGEVNPVRGQRGVVEEQREQTSNGVKIAETALSDLIQERLKLEEILQEINNLKGRICQRIGLLEMLEKGKKEIERAPNFLEEVKNKLDNLREHIK